MQKLKIIVCTLILGFIACFQAPTDGVKDLPIPIKKIKVPCGTSPILDKQCRQRKFNDSKVFVRKPIERKKAQQQDKMQFALRIVLISNLNEQISVEDAKAFSAKLNNSFYDSSFRFSITSIETLSKDWDYEILTQNNYAVFFDSLRLYNHPDKINLYLYRQPEFLLCDTLGGVYSSCHVVKGFSGVDSYYPALCMDARFFLDATVGSHEMGHFFGLSHTFEGFFIGIEEADATKEGDKVADTPIDPNTGALSALYNATTCSLSYQGYQTPCDNLMSYYPPCVLSRKKFTKGQIKRMDSVALQHHKKILTLPVR